MQPTKMLERLQIDGVNETQKKWSGEVTRTALLFGAGLPPTVSTLVLSARNRGLCRKKPFGKVLQQGPPGPCSCLTPIL